MTAATPAPAPPSNEAPTPTATTHTSLFRSPVIPSDRPRHKSAEGAVTMRPGRGVDVFREHWREPSFWQWWWQNRAPAELRGGVYLFLLALFLGGGIFAADSLSSASAGTGRARTPTRSPSGRRSPSASTANSFARSSR